MELLDHIEVLFLRRVHTVFIVPSPVDIPTNSKASLGKWHGSYCLRDEQEEMDEKTVWQRVLVGKALRILAFSTPWVHAYPSHFSLTKANWGLTVPSIAVLPLLSISGEMKPRHDIPLRSRHSGSCLIRGALVLGVLIRWRSHVADMFWGKLPK